ncbi:RdgB/HAM1 family non-canonical purine NTP pyrophosphatase [Micavibrio aeruginosavorus]|uniref:RdgB/HAM1 family non-canonical purine NTP pyrophosphatase n=1 Tax=Micavibrio aeruginosavorus TaxID=349221 RepID=UPI003F4AF64C
MALPTIEKLIMATHNAGKVAEIGAMLAPLGIHVVSAGELGLPEPDETETTFVGNALLKAHAAAKATNLPCLADDSGLCVNALNGDPGVYSARWAGPGKDFAIAMQTVHDKLGANDDRSAYFICVLALAYPDGSEYVFEGRVNGTLVWPARGVGGFGYDPMFVPDGDTRTFGEMNPAEKKKYSHRAIAFAALVDAL